METNAHSIVTNSVIGHQLFGSDASPEVLTKRLDTISSLRELMAKPAEFWANLATDCFTENYVQVIGLPDPKLVEAVANEVLEKLLF